MTQTLACRATHVKRKLRKRSKTAKVSIGALPLMGRAPIDTFSIFLVFLQNKKGRVGLHARVQVMSLVKRESQKLAFRGGGESHPFCPFFSPPKRGKGSTVRRVA